MIDLMYEGLKLKIGKGVYDPKEDSFILAKAVEEFARGKAIDIGTGSGIQGIVAAKTGCEVTFVDISPDTLSCAVENAKANNVKGRFVRSDLFESVSGRYDTIIFNPPYVHSQELSKIGNPDLTVDGGKEGREVIERFISQYREHLEPGGIVLMVESSQNHYETDIPRLRATEVEKIHRFFEDLVVLKF